MEETTKNQTKWKRRITGAAAGTLAAASLAMGSLFASPEELLAVENGDSSKDAPAPIVSVGKYAAVPVPAKQKVSLADRLRAALLRLPLVLRALVLLPLWCLGQVGIWALSPLLSLLAPLWQILLSVLLNGLILFAVVAIAYKLLFPKRSVLDLLRGKNFLWLSVSALVLAATDQILRLTASNYGPVSNLIRIGLGFVLLLLLCWRILQRKRAASAQE